jgi:hypothetical protein
MERDKEQRGLAHRFSKERDKEQDGLGHIWEQDQDACLPAYRPLENKTERQTVSSARREQGRRALLTKRSKALPNPRSVPAQGCLALSRRNVPESNGGIRTSGGENGAIGREIEAQHRVCVLRECGAFLPGCQVP